MDSKKLTITTLSITAAILFAALLIVDRAPAPAFAAGMTAAAGDYVATVGTLTANDEELLYVIDNSASKMIAYRFDAQKKIIEDVEQIDLDALRRGAATPPPKKRP